MTAEAALIESLINTVSHLQKLNIDLVTDNIQLQLKTRPDKGYYYRMVPTDEVSAYVRDSAEQTFSEVVEELGLNDLPLRIVWYKGHPQIQEKLSRLWRAGDSSVFSEYPGLRGFVYPGSVLRTGAVHLQADWPSGIVRTTAHELRHVLQARQGDRWKCEVESERDADAYATEVYWRRVYRERELEECSR